MNSIKRIIIFFEIPFTSHSYGRFGVETFIKNNFDVEVWDFSSFLYGKFGLPEEVVQHDHFRYYRFSDKREIEDALSHLTLSDFVNCFIGFSYRTFFIYKVLSEKRIGYSIPLFNPIPVSCGHQSDGKHKSFVSLLKKIVILNKKTIFDHFVNKIIQNHFPFFGIRPATLCIASGSASMDLNQFPVKDTTHILWTHSTDYDIFLQNTGDTVSPYEGCAIFLDDFLPFHPDFAMVNEAAPVSPEEYYPKLCMFFSYLEVKFGVRIIIAAHPRSTYEKLPDYFEGRPIVRGKTAQLVKDCSFVIVHASTSINFAVIYQKPVVFLTMDAFRKTGGISRMGEIIENMASLLGKTPHNLDHLPSINFEHEMVIDKMAYAVYKNTYIKKEGSKETGMWQILSDYLKQN